MYLERNQPHPPSSSVHSPEVPRATRKRGADGSTGGRATGSLRYLSDTRMRTRTRPAASTPSYLTLTFSRNRTPSKSKKLHKPTPLVIYKNWLPAYRQRTTVVVPARKKHRGLLNTPTPPPRPPPNISPVLSLSHTTQHPVLGFRPTAGQPHKKKKKKCSSRIDGTPGFSQGSPAALLAHGTEQEQGQHAEYQNDDRSR